MSPGNIICQLSSCSENKCQDSSQPRPSRNGSRTWSGLPLGALRADGQPGEEPCTSFEVWREDDETFERPHEYLCSDTEAQNECKCGLHAGIVQSLL